MANFYGTDIDNLNGDPTDVNHYGGDGNDVLKGAAGANALYGGEGNDVLVGGNAVEAGDFTGTGTSADDPYVFNEDKPSGDDTLEGGGGSDGLYGFDGNDKLYGGDGDDQGIIASDWAATTTYYVGGLFGGEGNDRIYGGDGDDEITGGMGRDQLWGGDDADRFIFGSNAETAKSGKKADVIHDFNRKQDDIVDLTGIDAKNGGGNNKFKYIGDDDFSGKKGELRYENFKLQGDTNGDGKADFTIKMLGVAKLTNADIDL
jgi:Ca2+-binding RTX toxin-like protein